MEALSIQTVKPALRRQFREARRRFIASSGREASSLLHAHLRRLLTDLSTQDHQTALYRAMPEEAGADLAPLTEYYFPRLTDGEQMEFWRPRREDAFELNSFKIPEPIQHSSDRLDSRRPVLVCCPAVAADWSGNRLGMGKGYYDRFFASNPEAIRIGVLYQVQMSKDPLPAESWDQTLDWIVTEKMILRTSKRSP